MKTKHRLIQQLRHRAKTPKPYTIKTLVQRAMPWFKKMLKQGHDYDDLAAIFQAHRVAVDAETIRTFVTGTKVKSKQQESQENVPEETAQALLAAFEHQASIRKGLTRQELVADLFESIALMLAARYDFDDIAAFLNDQGVAISPATLKTYYKQAKQQRVQQGETALPVQQKIVPETHTSAKKKPHPPAKPRLPESPSLNRFAKEFNL